MEHGYELVEVISCMRSEPQKRSAQSQGWQSRDLPSRITDSATMISLGILHDQRQPDPTQAYHIPSFAASTRWKSRNTEP